MRIFLIAAVLIAAPCFAAEDPKTEAGIKALFAQVDACIAKKDSQCLGAVFTDDATMLSPAVRGTADVPKILKGKAEIVKTLGPLIKESPASQKTSVRNLRMVGSDHALVDCSVDISQGAAGAAGYHCAALVVLKDGKWLLQDIRSITVADLSPRPTPPACPTVQVGPTAQSGAPVEQHTPAPTPPPGDEPPKS